MRAVITALDVIFAIILAVSMNRQSKSAKIISICLIIGIALNIGLIWW